MPKIGTLFGELLKLVPRFHFEKAVSTHKADRYSKKFSSWNQLTTLLYAQITGKESLREIETGLAAQQTIRHPGGERKSVPPSTGQHRIGGSGIY